MSKPQTIKFSDKPAEAVSVTFPALNGQHPALHDTISVKSCTPHGMSKTLSRSLRRLINAAVEDALVKNRELYDLNAQLMQLRKRATLGRIRCVQAKRCITRLERELAAKRAVVETESSVILQMEDSIEQANAAAEELSDRIAETIRQRYSTMYIAI